MLNRNELSLNKSKIDSDLISSLRFLAIIGVVSAHTYYLPSQTYISNILNLFGRTGVGLFFVIAGYLFAFNNDNFSSLLSKKFKTLIIPWVFTGTAVYLYNVIRKGGDSVFSYIKWILGSGTYLWYMVTLLLLYLIFGICRRWKISIYFVPILGLVSYLLNGYLYKFLSPWGGQYYNVFNWMIFFTAGYAVALFNLEEKLSDFLKKFGLVISVI